MRRRGARARATVEKSAGLPLVVRVVWGSLLLACPAAMLRLLDGHDDGGAPRQVMRVLGARHLLEAGAERRFGRRARQIGVGVDALHAATGVGFGLYDARWRRAAWSDATVSAAFGLLGALGDARPPK